MKISIKKTPDNSFANINIEVSTKEAKIIYGLATKEKNMLLAQITKLKEMPDTTTEPVINVVFENFKVLNILTTALKQII
jgi:hypothetical protein